MKAILLGFLAALTFTSLPVRAQDDQSVPALLAPADDGADTNGMDELDPFDPNIETTLQWMDLMYEFQTGQSAHLPNNDQHFFSSCYRQTCPVWILVEKSTQTAYLYLNGNPTYTWLVSTGVPGRDTPDFDTHPDGRVYDRYTSTKFPGGDWNGMGNMPYAVFISGGFAIHGTGQSNWKKLGHRASHGCVRLHPDNAYIFNRLNRQWGSNNVWVTIE